MSVYSQKSEVAFLSYPLGDLRVTYAIYTELVQKLVVLFRLKNCESKYVELGFC